MPPPSCMVLHCTGLRSNPDHELRVPEEGGWRQVPVCAEHWLRIDSGELWLWVPGGRLKGVGSDLAEGCVLMGEELAGYGLVIDADVRIHSSHVYSPHLVDDPHTPTLAIDGRVFGAGEHISIELVLTPQTVKRLKEALRFFRT